MDLDVLIQETLARFAFLLLIAGASIRMVLFLSTIIVSSSRKSVSSRSISKAMFRSILPLHCACWKRPVYVFSRYVFHLCLVIVPLGFSSHLYLLEEHDFTVYWDALSDRWIDRLTLLVIGFALYFLARRIFTRESRASSASYTALILITAFPFLTGYALTHGSLNFIPFLSRNLENIHAVSGEVMMIMAVFLFLGVRMKSGRCTGCASCTAACPTQALRVQDDLTKRIFKYTQAQCIRCASCVNTCPENAAELRHVFSAAGYLRVFRNQSITAIELAACKRCGRPFAPKPQLAKLERIFSKEMPSLCPGCKQREAARTVDGRSTLLTVMDISATPGSSKRPYRDPGTGSSTAPFSGCHTTPKESRPWQNFF